ncbi:MAG: outer membrane beta-barrel protein [Acidobacteriota bacterium]
MNKISAILLMVTFLIIPALSSDYSLNFNINYNIGNSDFFSRTENLYVSGGYNYLENKRNKLGMGFNLGINIPITKKLSVLPGFAIDFGHQNYEFSMVEKASDSDIKDNYFFYIYSGELKLNYNIFSFKNGWKMILAFGINYYTFKGDEAIGLEDSSFWGVISGIGAQYFQLEHFGFQAFILYKYPLKEKDFQYLTLRAGVIYRF